ncbi:hypothetical protein ACEN9X_20300 [Mucilaginibacter sp. Mucisp86]|uniref:DUF6932 family protein n=1 Tax=Mucilaginibacter sp. Mucisp86 TaxID=3243060 RepID=UPI0039B45477
MIPELAENGILPPGIHICEIKELEAKFVYNLHRRNLYNGLVRLVQDLKSINAKAIYVDGSFVTAKLMPGDIDVCWDEGTGTGYEYELANLPILFNRQLAKARYLADIFPAAIMEQGSKKLFIDFFQIDKQTGEQKGILKINLF